VVVIVGNLLEQRFIASVKDKTVKYWPFL